MKLSELDECEQPEVFIMIDTFEKKSVLGMMFLSFITGGFYVPYYFLKLKESTDTVETTAYEVLPKIKFLFVCWTIFVGYRLSIWLSMILPGSLNDSFSGFTPYSSLFLCFVGLLGLSELIVMVFLAFDFRDKLDDHLNGTLKKRISFSSLATFFFGIYYLQYKINKALMMPPLPMLMKCKNCKNIMKVREQAKYVCPYCKEVFRVTGSGRQYSHMKRREDPVVSIED